MISKKIRILRILRQVLSVFAVGMLLLTVVSGFFAFSGMDENPKKTNTVEDTDKVPVIFPEQTLASYSVTERETVPEEEPIWGNRENAEPYANDVLPAETQSAASASNTADTTPTQQPLDRITEENPEQPLEAAIEDTLVQSSDTSADISTEKKQEHISDASAEEAQGPITDPSAEEVQGPITDPSAEEVQITKPSITQPPFIISIISNLPPNSKKEAKPEILPVDSTPKETTETYKSTIFQDYSGRSSTVTSTEIEETTAPEFPWHLIFAVSVFLTAASAAGILILSWKIKQLEKQRHTETIEAASSAIAPNQKTESHLEAPESTGTITETPLGRFAIGFIQGQGGRKYQQDCSGHSIILNGSGLLAVVADGMGGLQNGDKVSQLVVQRFLELGNTLQAGREQNALMQILGQVNEDVNRFLTPEGIYKSGTTLVAVLVNGDMFHWISVGDSRIYLYREGFFSQLNRDHDQLQEWIPEILNGTRSMEESLRNPDGRKLTSFLGMGKLKYVDYSLSGIRLQPGDRLVLVSDGVYCAVSEEVFANVLKRYSNVQKAAEEIERQIHAAQLPHQDNYTALILGF